MKRDLLSQLSERMFEIPLKGSALVLSVASAGFLGKPPKHSQNTPTVKHLEKNLMLSGVSSCVAHAVERPLLNYVSDQINYADVLHLDTLRPHCLFAFRSRRTSSRQRDESAETGTSRILTPTHGLDVRKNFSAPFGRRGSIFLDIPF